jgi:apolipoprotein N-acyltransferase
MVPWHVNKSSDEKNFSVSLLQGNIPQDLKYTKLREQAVQWYVEKAVQAETDLVVMPETAIPYLRQDIPNDEWQKLARISQEGKKPSSSAFPLLKKTRVLVTPLSRYKPTQMSTCTTNITWCHLGNSSQHTSSGLTRWSILGSLTLYAAHSSQIPLFGMAKTSPSKFVTKIYSAKNWRRRFAVDQKNIPSLLVNMSNIAWFGNTVVIPQHLHIARMRSIELNRPTIRATNSGGTAIIDASGKVQAVAKPYTQTVLVGNVPASDGRVTWFTQWAGRWGLLPMLVFCSAIVLGFAVTGHQAEVGDTESLKYQLI